MEGELDETTNWYVLLWGLRPPDDDLVLAPGVALRGLGGRLQVFDLAAAGAVGFREWAVLEPMANGCTCEIETAWDSELPPGFDTLNRAWLASTMLVVRGYATTMPVAASTYSWRRIRGHSVRRRTGRPGHDEQLPRFNGRLLDFHMTILGAQELPPHPVLKEDADWVGQHFEVFNRLATENERFMLALQSAVDWRYTKDPRLGIARIWTGIEALIAVSSELVYRVSTICASILEPRGPTRRARYGATKKLYGFRSKAVHGAALKKTSIDAALLDSRDLLFSLITKAVERGNVWTEADFEQALFE